MISKELSNKMANMGLVCSLLVVILHTIGDMPVVRSVVSIAVPYFFMASGFFLALRVDESGWWRRAIAKRIRTLAVPFFLWFFIGVILYSLLGVSADLMLQRPFGSSIVYFKMSWLGRFGLQLNEYPMGLGALWYVRGLFLLTIASPILVWGVRKTKWLFPVLGIAAWVVYCYFLAGMPMNKSVVMGLFGIGFPMAGLCYFTIGIYLQRFPVSYHCPSSGALALFVGIVTMAMSRWLPGFLPSTIVNRIPIPFLLYGIWALMPSAKWPGWLTSLAFPIYVMHGCFTPYLFVLIGALPISSPLVGLAVLIITVPACILAAVLMKRFAPPLAAILFGGR